MRTIESDCVHCGSGNCWRCPKRRVVHYYCDRCQFEIDPSERYVECGFDLCEDCLKEIHLKKGDTNEQGTNFANKIKNILR